MVKMKVIKGHEAIQNKVLSLIEVDEMLFRCLDSKVTIVDCWGEISMINSIFLNSGCTDFIELNLFIQSDKELLFIDEVEVLNHE